MNLSGLSIFLFSFGAGAVLVPLVRGFASRHGLVAPPRPDRWHRRPTALLGGIGIWGASAIGLAVSGVGAPNVLGVFAAGTLLAVFGLFDDLRPVRPASKLLAQFAAAAAAVACGFEFSWFGNGILDFVVSVAWIIAVSNAVNLLDHMDGLAGGVALIAAQILGWSLASDGHPETAALALSVGGALAGFLVYNVNPASIFMGDCGSLFVGFTLACLAIVDQPSGNLVSFVAGPAMILIVPILDTALVSFTRLLNGRSIAEGGRDHGSHRLVALGLSEREAVAFLWVLSFTAGAFAIVYARYAPSLALGLLPIILGAFGVIGVYLSRSSFAVRADVARRFQSGFARLLAEAFCKHRVFDIVFDLVLVAAAHYLSYGLQFGFDFADPGWARFRESLPIVALATPLVFYLAGIHRGLWRYAGTDDLLRYVLASALAMALSVLAILVIHQFDGYRPQVFLLTAILTLLGVGGSRFFFCLIDERLSRRRGHPVLLVGAGDRGEMAVRFLLRDGNLGLRVAGFVDDDRLKVGRRIHGYRVCGTTGDLERIQGQTVFAEILVTAERLSQESMLRLEQFCTRRKRKLRIFRVELAPLAASIEKEIAFDHDHGALLGSPEPSVFGAAPPA